MGAIEGDFNGDAISDLEFPKTVTVPMACYTSEEAAQISMLRQERWALLAHFDAMAERSRYSHTNAYKNKQLRLAVVQEMLYQLTGNPIYHV